MVSDLRAAAGDAGRLAILTSRTGMGLGEAAVIRWCFRMRGESTRLREYKPPETLPLMLDGLKGALESMDAAQKRGHQRTAR
jgi:hypothetical protein